MTVTRKLGVDARVARRKLELLAEFDVAGPDVTDILAAIDLHRLHDFVDHTIRATGGRWVLLTEDLQAAREIDGLRIVNPLS